MKRSLLGGALLLAQQAFADPGLSMQLQLLDRSQQLDHYLSQYEVTLTNTGTESFSSLTLVPTDIKLRESNLGSNEILVPQLNVGDQLIVLWDMKTFRSVEYYLPGKPIHFDVHATDSTGEIVDLSVETTELPLP